MKIRSVGAELFMRTDGPTGRHMTKLTVSFSNIANTPNNETKAVKQLACAVTVKTERYHAPRRKDDWKGFV